MQTVKINTAKRLYKYNAEKDAEKQSIRSTNNGNIERNHATSKVRKGFSNRQPVPSRQKRHLRYQENDSFEDPITGTSEKAWR